MEAKLAEGGEAGAEATQRLLSLEALMNLQASMENDSPWGSIDPDAYHFSVFVRQDK